MSKPLTKAQKLAELKSFGLADEKAKSFTPRLSKVFDHYKREFPKRAPAHLKAVKVSAESARVLKSVGMDLIGDRLVFPAYNHSVKVKETKHGVIVTCTAPVRTKGVKPVTYDIVLSKDTDKHIQYGLKIARDRKRKAEKALEKDDKVILPAFGRLRSADYKLSDGRIKHGYMRDMVNMSTDPRIALQDDRYNSRDRYEEMDDEDDTGIAPNVTAIIIVH